MNDLNQIVASRIALELRDLGGMQDWYLIAAEKPVEAAGELIEALDAAGVASHRLTVDDPHDLRLDGTDETACVLTVSRAWDTSEYATLDRLRAAIRAARPILIWVATPTEAAALLHSAPNLAAFFAPGVGTWSDESMTEAEREVHLVALRERYGQTDAEILELATTGGLPSDADHDAWLVLLGRGDLIAPARAGAR